MVIFIGRRKCKSYEKIEKEIMGFNILNVKIESTGLRGGDSGHGGRTVLDWRIMLLHHGI